jgi:hypothetical protein
LEETVTADILAEDEINSRHLRYSGSRPRRVAVSAADDDMMVVVVVVVVKVVEWFEFGDCKGQTLAMESVCEGGRSWVLKSLVGGMSSPNPDATEGHK